MLQDLLELARICWSFRNRNWYRRFPFLPFPPKKYLQWRLETAYGDKSFRNLRWHDVVAYARWHRAMRLNLPSSLIDRDDLWE